MGWDGNFQPRVIIHLARDCNGFSTAKLLAATHCVFYLFFFIFNFIDFMLLLLLLLPFFEFKFLFLLMTIWNTLLPRTSVFIYYRSVCLWRCRRRLLREMPRIFQFHLRACNSWSIVSQTHTDRDWLVLLIWVNPPCFYFWFFSFETDWIIDANRTARRSNRVDINWEIATLVRRYIGGVRAHLN